MSLTSEERKTIADIMYSNRLIATVIKDLEELRRNLNIFLYSGHEQIRSVYEEFRKRLVMIIRNLFINILQYPYQDNESRKLPQDPIFETIRANIEHERSKINELELEINKIIADLLSEKKISSKIASSVLNDSVYVTRIGINLLTIMELVYTEIHEMEIDERKLEQTGHVLSTPSS
jgi:phosphate:Na+ symporter